MSPNDDFVRLREPWELAHECETAIRRARRRRSVAARVRTRAPGSYTQLTLPTKA
jgi:hypothetical protein